MRPQRRLWIGLGVLVLLSPLGLWLPKLFHAGEAWGEWSPETLNRLAGYLPAGLQHWADVWKAPLPDYVFIGWEGKGLPALSLAYLLSAVLGVGLTVALAWLLARWLSKEEN